MLRFVSIAALALGLGGCAVTAVVGAAASVVGAGVDVAGSVVSGTIDVVSSGVSGAIDLATSEDDDDAQDKKIGPEKTAAKQVIAGAKPETLSKNADTETTPGPSAADERVDTVLELGD